MNSNAPDQRARLLVLTSTFPAHLDDGGPSFVLELANRLAAHFDITVLAPHAPGLKQEERWDSLTIRRFRYAPEAMETLAAEGGIQAQLRSHPWKYLLVPLFLLSQWWHCRKLLHCGQFDAIHAHWLFPQGLIALACGNTPIIVTAHGSDLHSLRGPLFRHIQCHVLKHSQVVTVVSAAMAKLAREIQNQIHDLRILPMGVDLQTRFTPSPHTREPATFLFVGRLVASKGLDVLLAALALLKQQIPDVRLVVIGRGPEETCYRELVHTHSLANHVTFLGALPSAQLPEWYRRATALVSPTHTEGLGLALIEAAGCASPIIASDLPAVREILIDGVSGRLTPASDSIALASAMLQVVTDPDYAAHLGQAARIHVVDRYDWPCVARGYSAAIKATVTSTP